MSETFEPQIRRAILRALDDHIIPALQNEKPLQVLAEPPFDFGKAEHWPIRKQWLPPRAIEPLQFTWSWMGLNLIAGRAPFIGFVYRGVADERIGLTKAAAESHLQKGEAKCAAITAVRLPAPAVISIPPGIAHSIGTNYREPSLPGDGPSSILWIDLLADTVLPHLCSSFDEDFTSHLLEIEDPLLAQMGRLYMDELREARGDGSMAAPQAQLLVFTLRMRRYLSQHQPPLANSCWVVSSRLKMPPASVKGRRDQAVCHAVMHYIETHLSSALTLDVLAQEAGISTAHLCRVFHRTSGTTLMRYITERRIEAAKVTLRLQPERIVDMAKLVGFASPASFSTVFKRMVGCSPREFSRQADSDKTRIR